MESEIQNISWDSFWDQNGGQMAFASNHAQPVHCGPFFEGSSAFLQVAGTEGKLSLATQITRTYPTSPSQKLRRTKPQSLSGAHDLTQPQRLRSAQNPQMQSSKRQRIQSPVSLSKKIQPSDCSAQFYDANSASTPPSECCSSCPDGIPCDEPDCVPCDSPDCNLDRDDYVPCDQKSCDKPACTDQCLSIGVQNLQFPESYGLDQNRRMSKWVESTWGAQASDNIGYSREKSLDGVIDPTLKAARGTERVSASSSVPQTPSLVANIRTPYSPPNEIPSPQFGHFLPQNTYLCQAADILPTTAEVFNTSNNAWSSLENGNDANSPMFCCTWEGCDQPFTSQQDWIPHLHRDHVDPQMYFGCPIQEETCPTRIETNPLDHLQNDHGYNFDLNGGMYSCPAPDCLPEENFCDPAMLHNHFDIAHSTPTQGFLQCRLETCGSSFGDWDTFYSHINQNHQLPPALPQGTNGESAISAKTNSFELPIDQATLPIKNDAVESKEETTHCCKWKPDHEHICGQVFTSEAELQSHITKEHLDLLDKRSGYKCQWDDCVRASKRGEKAGFTQRGKLERHMATHTNFKSSICDICGKTFSAAQSMKQHRLLHTGEKPWKCKYCGKAFPQQSACTVHERTHTNEKPLECPTCGKRFSESSNLAKHRKIHGERGLHVCTFHGCGKSFHRLDQLKRHANVHARALGKMRGDDTYENESVVVRTETQDDSSEEQ